VVLAEQAGEVLGTLEQLGAQVGGVVLGELVGEPGGAGGQFGA
jgi:hypothetical protein